MSNLIRSGLVRLFKCKGFYAAIVFSAVTACLSLSGDGMYFGREHKPVCDFYICNWLSLFPFAAAILCCMFCADEYRGGAVRSKIAVGHKKTTIYLSNLIVCSAGSLIVFAIGLVFCAVFAGLSRMVWISSLPQTLYALAVSAAVVIGSTAFTLFFSMLISRPAAAAAVVMIITAGTLYLFFGVSERLNFPEYRIAASGVDSKLFESVMSETKSYDEKVEIAREYGWLEENPYYIGGAKRLIAYTAYLFPSAQAPVLYSAVDDAIYSGDTVAPLLKSPLPCAAFSAVLTAFGAILFGRKNMT